MRTTPGSRPEGWPALLLSLWYLQIRRRFQQSFNLRRDLLHRLVQRLQAKLRALVAGLPRGKQLSEPFLLPRQRTNLALTPAAAPQLFQRRFQPNRNHAGALQQQTVLLLHKGSAAECQCKIARGRGLLQQSAQRGAL